MENQNKPSDGVISEVDLLELLNIEQRTLDRLRREKGFPYVRLDQRNRVYLISEVTGWLKQQQRVT